jgi:hypothetical protein
MEPKQKQKGANSVFRGQSAVVKLLTSVKLPDGSRMEVSRVECYHGQLGHCWEADTNAGKRWVRYGGPGCWHISRTPPSRKRAGV